jgi:hypothetical protein
VIQYLWRKRFIPLSFYLLRLYGSQLKPQGDFTSRVNLAPDPSILVDLEAPACKRLISHAFSPHEVISLVEAVFANKDEVKMVRELRGDDAQTFVDVVHGVRLHFLHSLDAVCLPFSTLTPLLLNLYLPLIRL